MKSGLLALLAPLSWPAHAQEPGHRLVGPMSATETLLFDTRGVLVHTWPSDHKPGMAVYMKANGNLLRAIVTREGPSGTGGGLQEQTIDGRVVWDVRFEDPELLPHHDIAPLPNGNVLVVAWERLTAEEATAAGLLPERHQGPLLACRLLELRPAGPTDAEVVWSWRAVEHLHPRGPIELGDARTDGELNHVNGIDYDPELDWVVVAAAFQDELWVIDRASGRVVFRHGRQGTDDGDGQRLAFPHAPRFVPRPGELPHLLVFDNRAEPRTRVLELALERVGVSLRAEPVWSYAAPGFDSDYMGSAERLPGGNTLVCSSMQLRVFEVEPTGRIVGELGPAELPSFPFHATYVARCLWADRETLRISERDTVRFRIIAGSVAAGGSWFLTERGPGPDAPGTLVARGRLDERGGASTTGLAPPPAPDWIGLDASFAVRILGAGRLAPGPLPGEVVLRLAP